MYFSFTATATTEIYTLSLHDALPIFQQCLLRPLSAPYNWPRMLSGPGRRLSGRRSTLPLRGYGVLGTSLLSYHHCRSEEHTSELQSRRDLVCRLLLEKKKNKKKLTVL